MKTDVLIVGAGPAGLVAAIEVSKYGLNAIVIEERQAPGGRLSFQTHIFHDIPGQSEELRGFEIIHKLTTQLDEKVKLLLGHSAIGVYSNGTIGVTNGEVTFPIEARAIIVCTGTYQKPVIFPGWTLPGVMSVDATLALLNNEWVLPGKTTVIIGASNLSYLLAFQLQDMGTNVSGIISTSDDTTDNHLLNEALNRKINIYDDVTSLKANGNNSVQSLTFLVNGEEVEAQVDFISIDGGTASVIELLQLLECELKYDQDVKGWVPTYNADLQTSRDHIYIAGRVVGLAHQGSVLLSGKIAGISAAQSLDKLAVEDAEMLKLYFWEKIQKLESSERRDSMYTPYTKESL